MVFIAEMWGIPKKKEPGDKYDNRFFQCHDKFWQQILKLAREHGWKPIGTIPSDADSLQVFIDAGCFDPSYEPGDYGRSKMVLAKDALGMATALEKAIATVPTEKLEIKTHQALLLRDDMTEDDLIDANRGMTKRHIQEFIIFLKKGGFGYAWDD